MPECFTVSKWPINVFGDDFKWCLSWGISDESYSKNRVKVVTLTCPKQSTGQILHSRTTLLPSSHGSDLHCRPPAAPPACPVPHRAGPACTSTGTSPQVKTKQQLNRTEGKHQCSPLGVFRPLSLSQHGGAVGHAAQTHLQGIQRSAVAQQPISSAAVVCWGGVKLIFDSLSLATLNHFSTRCCELTTTMKKKQSHSMCCWSEWPTTFHQLCLLDHLYTYCVLSLFLQVYSFQHRPISATQWLTHATCKSLYWSFRSVDLNVKTGKMTYCISSCVTLCWNSWYKITSNLKHRKSCRLSLKKSNATQGCVHIHLIRLD